MNLEKLYLELGAKEVYFSKDNNNKCTIFFTDAEWVKASDFVKSYYAIN